MSASKLSLPVPFLGNIFYIQLLLLVLHLKPNSLFLWSPSVERKSQFRKSFWRVWMLHTFLNISTVWSIRSNPISSHFSWWKAPIRHLPSALFIMQVERVSRFSNREVAACSLVDVYRRFIGFPYLHHQSDHRPALQQDYTEQLLSWQPFSFLHLSAH